MGTRGILVHIISSGSITAAMAAFIASDAAEIYCAVPGHHCISHLVAHG